MAFVTVAQAAYVPVGKAVYVEAAGLALAVFNLGGGRFRAVTPLCPHEDGPLAEGWLEGGSVVCPWHGYDFDLATGRCNVDASLAVGVYETRVVDGEVEVDIP
ncbi:MAG: Rieske (2Fe-2S) protein [Candidatus Rokuibacteriota bacterium]